MHILFFLHFLWLSGQFTIVWLVTDLRLLGDYTKAQLGNAHRHLLLVATQLKVLDNGTVILI